MGREASDCTPRGGDPNIAHALRPLMMSTGKEIWQLTLLRE